MPSPVPCLSVPVFLDELRSFQVQSDHFFSICSIFVLGLVDRGLRHASFEAAQKGLAMIFQQKWHIAVPRPPELFDWHAEEQSLHKKNVSVALFTLSWKNFKVRIIL